MKLFNLNGLYFADPKFEDEEEQKNNLAEGWYLVETQQQIDDICVSYTQGGEVWQENGILKWSGKAPSENHRWNTDKKKWVALTVKEKTTRQIEILTQKKTALLQELAAKAAELRSKHLTGYSSREEQEARGDAPIMLLDELFALGGYKTMDDLKAAIIAKADTLAIIEGALIAQETAFKRQIQSAELNNIDEIKAEVEQWR